MATVDLSGVRPRLVGMTCGVCLALAMGCASETEESGSDSGGTGGGVGSGGDVTGGVGGAAAAGSGAAGTGGSGGTSGGVGGAGTAGTGAAGTSGSGGGSSGTETGGAAGNGSSGDSGSGGEGAITASGGSAGTPASAGAPSTGDTWTWDPTAVDAQTLAAPPDTWLEHWFEHVQLLQLMAYNDDVAIYFDADVQASSLDWIHPFMTRLWNYTRWRYGEFQNATTDGRLYAIFHTGKYSGGHPSTYFDSSHDYRNVSDCGPGGWTSPGYDLPTHETAHVVEGASQGYHGSPAFGIWGDSKWAEFYLYDVYVELDLPDEAARVYDAFMAGTDDFPQANTNWFRDWFYPLWRDYGHGQVMANYFELVAEHWTGGGMNWGEYVHFTSGAAGANLKALANTAFGPNYPTDAEFAQAQADFAAITY